MAQTVRPCKTCLTRPRQNAYSQCAPCLRLEARAKKKLKDEKVKARKERRKEKKLNSVPKLKKDLDKVISEYVRRKSADWQENVKCTTCPKVAHWKTMHAGHYNSRTNYNTRYDLRNLAIQCFKCNMKMGGCKAGNYPEFTDYLLENYGAEWLKKLIDDGRKTRQWIAPELQAEISKYQELLKAL